ncbi:MAG: cation:proton antiporter, partial [Wenzhouxiangellaceae bacterium]
LVAVLFIVITARLEFDQLRLLTLDALWFVLAVLVLIRPLSVWLATLGAGLRRGDRALLAWIAPRGIVAAATAGLFGPELTEAGYADAALLLPVVFAVIIATVIAHGITMGPLGRRLGLAAPDDHGLLIVGASPWSLELARKLRERGVEILMVDGVWRRLKPARMANIDAYYGEILSDHAEHELETHHIGHVLCATPNDFYNALVCNALGPEIGRHRTLQLATSENPSHESRRLTADQRGHLAFGEAFDFDWLQQRLDQGWRIQATRLTGEFTFDQLKQRLGENGRDWLLLGAITPERQPRLYSVELPFDPENDFEVLWFGPDE